MTAHKVQGMTIDNAHAIYEYDRMKHDMLYVALTRTSKEEMLISVTLKPIDREQVISTCILIIINHT